MTHDEYKTFSVSLDRGVAFVSFNNPPVNLMTIEMLIEIDKFGRSVADDDDVRVIVFQSENPDFFIAHFDVEAIAAIDLEEIAKGSEPDRLVHVAFERFRTMPKVSIGKIDGIARGGGSELLLSLDMRFGSLERTVLAQPEVAIGIIPGGSGTQRLSRLCGRSRALEIALGCQDFDAATAERYGYINRAMPAAELDEFVDGLAYRIASYPAYAVGLAKQAVLDAEIRVDEGLVLEGRNFDKTLLEQETHDLMAKFMANGGQTHEVEVQTGIDFSDLSGSTRAPSR